VIDQWVRDLTEIALWYQRSEGGTWGYQLAHISGWESSSYEKMRWCAVRCSVPGRVLPDLLHSTFETFKEQSQGFFCDIRLYDALPWVFEWRPSHKPRLYHGEPVLGAVLAVVCVYVSSALAVPPRRLGCLPTLETPR
jgi:hypothetical protein